MSVIATAERRPFQPDEDAIIRANWKYKSSATIGSLIGREGAAVRVRARRLGLQPKAPGPDRVQRAVARVLPPRAPARRKQPDPATVSERASARWRVEEEIERRTRLAGLATVRCICGKPGSPFCDHHTEMLRRHGVR